MRRQLFSSGLVVLFLLGLLGLALPVSTSAQDTDEDDDSDRPLSLEIDPLDARFGGTRTSFEREYGDPSKADAGEYPRGDDYRIDGYKRVSVFYHENRIVHLTLHAPTEDFWTTKQADEARDAFLPTDVKLGTAVETADGEPLVRAKSAALAEEIDQDVYDEYEVKGKPGDLSVTYQLDKRERVKAIDVELGRVDSASASSQGNADDDQAYLLELRRQFDALAQSMDLFDQTLTGLGNGTINAQTAGTQLATAWTVWRQANADAQQLSPPASQQDTHDLYLQLTELLATAADEYQAGLVGNNQALLQAGDQKYSQARILRILIQAALESAGV